MIPDDVYTDIAPRDKQPQHLLPEGQVLQSLPDWQPADTLPEWGSSVILADGV
jgi:hypothetical protein